jgi:hypothetical protein
MYETRVKRGSRRSRIFDLSYEFYMNKKRTWKKSYMLQKSKNSKSVLINEKALSTCNVEAAMSRKNTGAYLVVVIHSVPLV